jgi:CDP-glucose 4,6-dehydratase
MFNNIYENKKVLLTGHTGFKGSWLALWLTKLGADVCGYSLAAPTDPNHFEHLNLDIRSEIGNILDTGKLEDVFVDFQPEIVFHMAAQPLVRLSYREPRETFETNVLGTVNVLEACRKTASVKAIVNVTSDKCYDNKEWIWGYRENDVMGGHDPYSASKGCAELVAASYRNAFFNPKDFGSKHNVLLASCRAGNVIGGGDWADDRLIPDIMRAVSRNEKVEIRNPGATRPWQHVLEPLSGYLQIGQKLAEKDVAFAEGWNFGPDDNGSITVREVVENIKCFWSKIDYKLGNCPNAIHEANLLKLDCSKAHSKLKWQAVWDSEMTFRKTVEWYHDFYEKNTISSSDDLHSYIEDAKRKGLEWTK